MKLATPTRKIAVCLAAVFSIAAPALAAEVNVYSSRHYDTDDVLYDKFTEETGIKVNRVEAKADELIARMRAEGNNSPADVFGVHVTGADLWAINLPYLTYLMQLQMRVELGVIVDLH